MIWFRGCIWTLQLHYFFFYQSFELFLGDRITERHCVLKVVILCAQTLVDQSAGEEFEQDNFKIIFFLVIAHLHIQGVQNY